MRQRTQGSILLLVLISLHSVLGQTPSSSPSPTTTSGTSTTDDLLMPMTTSSELPTGSQTSSSSSTSVTPAPSNPPLLFSGSGSGFGSAMFSCSFSGNISFSFEITQGSGLQFVVELQLVTFLDLLSIFFEDEEGAMYYSNDIRINYPPASETSMLFLDLFTLPFVIEGSELLHITEDLTSPREYNFEVEVFPPSTAPAYCQVETLFVSVTVFPALAPVCESGPSLQFAVTQYDFIIEAFAAELNCLSSDIIQYRAQVLSESATTAATFTVSENDRDAVFADHFAVGSHDLQVDVCNERSGACSETALSITLTVSRHQGRLLPFGSSYLDVARSFADDRAYSIIVPRRIPFWNLYYNRIYVSKLHCYIASFPASNACIRGYLTPEGAWQ